MPSSRIVVTTSPELARLYLERVNRAAKARKALKAKREEMRSWTQDQWNEWFEEQQRLHYVSSEVNTPVGTELTKKGVPRKRQKHVEEPEEIPKPERPKYPRKRKNEDAVLLASSQWTDERRQEQSERMKGNKIGVGHVPWNEGKKKWEDPRLQHIADVAHWQVKTQERSGSP